MSEINQLCVTEFNFAGGLEKHHSCGSGSCESSGWRIHQDLRRGALLTTRKYERTLRGERAAFGLIGKVFIYVLVPIVAPHYTRKFKRIW